MSLDFHRPASGGWLVIKDTQTGEVVYEGHGSGDEMCAILSHLGVIHEYYEYPDDEFEEKF